MKPKTFKLFMDFAHRVAEESTARRLKVGAVIVRDNNILGYGYNGTPQGEDNTCEDENNVTKPDVIHAELNAIYKLAKSNSSSDGAILIMTHSPCKPCAAGILHAGIKEVHYATEYRNTEAIDWLRSKGVSVFKCERV